MKPIRRDFAIRAIGCVACWIQGIAEEPCEKHHLNAHDMPGGKRRGEAYTVGLCQWHHVGRCKCTGAGRDCAVCRRTMGPSWRHHKRDFIDAFGTGDALLEKQDELLKQWELGVIG